MVDSQQIKDMANRAVTELLSNSAGKPYSWREIEELGQFPEAPETGNRKTYTQYSLASLSFREAVKRGVNKKSGQHLYRHEGSWYLSTPVDASDYIVDQVFSMCSRKLRNGRRHIELVLPHLSDEEKQVAMHDHLRLTMVYQALLSAVENW